MNRPQYLSKPTISGSHTPSTPNINPGGQGVTFNTDNGYISIAIAPGITPIIEYVSIANTSITNVNRVYVTIISSSVNLLLDSTVNHTVVTGFPDTPLPVNSTLIIVFETYDGKPPHNVTLSIIACFHPELTTTSVPSSK